jgi:hypothetical protein
LDSLRSSVRAFLNSVRSRWAERSSISSKRGLRNMSYPLVRFSTVMASGEMKPSSSLSRALNT